MMSAKRGLLTILVIGAALLTASVGPPLEGGVRALPPMQQPSPAALTIPYSGRLTDDSGQAVAKGTYDFTFTLYSTETGGTPLWSEVQQGVLVQAGSFTTALGRVKPVPQGADASGTLWLAVGVRGSGETEFTALTPRQRLSAAAPSSPTSGAACPHDHFGEEWIGADMDFGLRVLNTGDGVGVHGFSDNSDGVWGETQDAYSAGVRGTNSNGAGVFGSSTSDVGVHGESNSAGSIGVFGQSANGTGVVGYSPSVAGVHGYTLNGVGVLASSTNGYAIRATGTGKIHSSADSVLYLSPHDMVVRQASSGVVLTPLETGGMDILNQSGGTGVVKYVSVPVSTFGTLFDVPVYVKALEVCYKIPNILPSASIQETAVLKNVGSDSGYAFYLRDTTSRQSHTYDCYTANAATPRVAIDNSTWVQFNIHFSDQGTGFDVEIYTIKLTLTELQD